MQITRESGAAEAHRIRSYQPGRLTIDQRHFELGVIVTAATLVEERLPAAAAELGDEHSDAILALEPEIVLIGTGQSQVFPPRAFLASFLRRGVGVEVMDTGAACRTYNVLMAEGRRVAAALIVD